MTSLILDDRSIVLSIETNVENDASVANDDDEDDKEDDLDISENEGEETASADFVVD